MAGINKYFYIDVACEITLHDVEDGEEATFEIYNQDKERLVEPYIYREDNVTVIDFGDGERYDVIETVEEVDRALDEAKRKILGSCPCWSYTIVPNEFLASIKEFLPKDKVDEINHYLTKGIIEPDEDE